MFYWFAHALFFVASKLFFPIKARGHKSIPRDSGFIIASNHLSNLDPMLLGLASGRRLNYIAKQSLFKNPLFGRVLHWVGAFPIKRESYDTSAIKEALKRLKEGGGVVMFPEGTRKSVEGKKSVQPGIGFLAVKSGAPVVPAFIQGSEKVMPPGNKTITYGRITITFGKPEVYNKSKEYPEIAQHIMQAINQLSVTPAVSR